MRKFMKYEIKGTYRFILGLLVILLIASTIIVANISKEIKSVDLGIEYREPGFIRFLFVISALVIFGAFVTGFFYIVGSFRKELYEDRGYLTFTLPLTGNQILGGKLLVALFWYFVIFTVTILYNVILIAFVFKLGLIISLKEIWELIRNGGFSLIITSVTSTILSLIIIYFKNT